MIFVNINLPYGGIYMNHEELINFFGVLTILRDEYVQSDDSCRLEKVSSLAMVAVEVIKAGEIPHSFRITHRSPYEINLLTEPVEELFKRLSIAVTVTDSGTTYSPEGQICYAVFLCRNSNN